jgi:hypothetical protein
MKTPDSLDRRVFLKTTGAVIGAIATGAHASGFAHAASPFVRKDVLSLDPNGAEILALRAGVSVMKARPDTDPTSWSFQANIHGMLTQGQNNLWEQCQHGHWWFFPWHRMYLYYFERILRKAIQQSGTALPANFALPYWNYSDQDSARVLPGVFRARTYQQTPGGPQVANPLFEKNRRRDINDATNPTALNPDTVSYGDAFAQTQFISTDLGLDGFGGQMASVPVHLPQQNHGALEHSPHDLVHDGIGGLMGDPNTAANDPIFWLHHCNIDRLWNRWLRQGMNVNPDASSAWGLQTFSLADETGGTVTQPAYQFLEYITGNLIDYKYDDAPAAPVAAMAAPVAALPRGRAFVRPVHEGMPSLSSKLPIRLASFPASLSLTGKPTVLQIKVPEVHRQSLTQHVQGAVDQTRELYLEIGGIDLSTLPQSGYYEVFVNLPGGETPSRKSASYVGSLSTFALRQQLDAQSHGVPRGGSFSFPLTRVLQGLKAAGRWSPSELSVTFVPRELPPEEKNENPRLVFRYVGVQAVQKAQPAKKP